MVSYHFDFVSYKNIIEQKKYYFITAAYIIIVRYVYIYIFAVCQRIRYECTKS